MDQDLQKKDNKAEITHLKREITQWEKKHAKLADAAYEACGRDDIDYGSELHVAFSNAYHAAQGQQATLARTRQIVQEASEKNEADPDRASELLITARGMVNEAESVYNDHWDSSFK